MSTALALAFSPSVLQPLRSAPWSATARLHASLAATPRIPGCLSLLLRLPLSVSQARLAEEAGAVAVMALERIPADIKRDGGVVRNRLLGPALPALTPLAASTPPPPAPPSPPPHHRHPLPAPSLSTLALHPRSPSPPTPTPRRPAAATRP